MVVLVSCLIIINWFDHLMTNKSRQYMFTRSLKGQTTNLCKYDMFHTLMQCMKLKVAFKVSFYFEECFHHEILPDVDADVESVMFQQKSYFFLNRDGLFHDIVIHL